MEVALELFSALDGSAGGQSVEVDASKSDGSSSSSVREAQFLLSLSLSFSSGPGPTQHTMDHSGLQSVAALGSGGRHGDGVKGHRLLGGSRSGAIRF